jgi:hypothetical protein
MAADLGVGFVHALSSARMVRNAGLLATEAVRLAASVLVRIDRSVVLVLAPQPHEIALLREHLGRSPGLAARIRIATPATIRSFLVTHRRAALMHYAVNRLPRVMPRLSARSLGQDRGKRGPRALLAAAIGLGLLAPVSAWIAGSLLCTLFFFNCSAWKLAAALKRVRPSRVEPVFERQLPTYTVLVPLYREAAVVDDLVAHLSKIDYPVAKLQVLLIVEADDDATRSAVARHDGSGPFQMIAVPRGGPRTKPKALTYALAFARGELVVVFDAEDRPEPDQLRKAAAAFRERPELGCVQARLTPDNEGSWFARMFAVEYAANFEVLLPALSDWRVPLPLGGTSNHFPRALLESVSGWDPFNVTEDADLGVRLARFGYRSTTIQSRTYEEAPVTFRQWLPQRRRWIKGWIQTVAVSIGSGIPLGLRLTLKERLAVHGILTAGVAGLLLYPISLVVVGLAAAAAISGRWPEGAYSWSLLAFNLANLTAVVSSAAISSWRGLRAAGAMHLVWHIPMLPAYWALMSLAAWQALFQYYTRPAEWEKTTHGVARDRDSRRTSMRLQV